MAPTQIGGFEVLGELGRGGMGVVYRARDPRDGRPVALKLLLTGRQSAAPQRQRFARETEVLRRLSHPHLVQLIAAGEEHGVPFVALELVEGGSLEDRLSREGPLPEREAATLALALARALAYVHSQGVIHRDVKPSNVLLDPLGAPRLTDFGVVKDLDPSRSRLTLSGQMVGTLGYLAPEQATDARQVGPATDVYGLGGVLYAALTGRPPIEGESMMDVLVATRDQLPRPPSSERAGLTPALEAICLRCLAKVPRDRYRDCDELAAALDAFLAGRPPRRRRGRRVAPVAFAGVVGALLAVGVMTALEASRRAAPPPGEPPVVAQVVTASVPVPPEPVAPPPADPEAVATLIDRGVSRARAGDRNGALGDYTAALALDPRCARAFFNRADARSDLGDVEGAFADYAAAIAADPTNVGAFVNRGNLRMDLGDLKLAMADFDAALAVDPRSAVALDSRGVARLKLGEIDAALADFDAAVAGTGLRPIMFVHRGLAHSTRRELDAAIADYTAALEADPTLLDAWVGRAAARMEGDRDLVGAIADYTAALDLRPPRPAGLLNNRGWARGRKGDQEGALADFDATLALDPQHANARYNRGDLLRARGDLVGARRDFEAALAARPDHPRADSMRAFLREPP